MGPLVFLDVETPNLRHNRIIELSLLAVSTTNGQTLLDRSWKINPETTVDPVNTSIHGITAGDVYEMPTFPQVWQEIVPFWIDPVVVAHNANNFDLPVLARTYYHYFRSALPETHYIFTLEKARQVDGKVSCGLNRCCCRRGIP